MDQYIIAAGALHRAGEKGSLMSIKGTVSGQEKKLLSPEGELVAITDIHHETACHGEDRVDRHTYVLTDGGGREHAAATPHYAAGSNPVDTGWPLCHMPRADHADVTLEGQEYDMVMHSGQDYSLYDRGHREVVHILHRGIMGGWTIEDETGLPPEDLCGLFVFCRYLERENEFMTV